jgi:hypothetical protein
MKRGISEGRTKPKRGYRGDTLTPAEAKIVRRREAQLKRGESKPWREVKDALSRWTFHRSPKATLNFPRDVRNRLERAIDEFDAKDDAQWSNVKGVAGEPVEGEIPTEGRPPIGSSSGSSPTAAWWSSRPSSSSRRIRISNVDVVGEAGDGGDVASFDPMIAKRALIVPLGNLAAAFRA